MPLPGYLVIAHGASLRSQCLQRKARDDGRTCCVCRQACHPGISSTDIYNKMDTSGKLTAKVCTCPWLSTGSAFCRGFGAHA